MTPFRFQLMNPARRLSPWAVPRRTELIPFYSPFAAQSSLASCCIIAGTDLPPGMEPVSELGLVLPTDQPCSFAEA
jgi:hypothetical protein